MSTYNVPVRYSVTNPSSDSAAIRQIIRGLKSQGYTLRRVNNGEDGWTNVKGEQDAISEAMACDEAWISFNGPDGKRAGHIYFVFGNEPFEVASDWSYASDEFDQAIQNIVFGWIG